jgi:hypothetical protein
MGDKEKQKSRGKKAMDECYAITKIFSTTTYVNIGLL